MSTESSLSRRRVLFSAAALAGSAVFMRELSVAADNPAAEVADRASDIKITAMRAVAVGGSIFVKISTNKGITGWGETAGIEGKVGAALMNSLYELLDGENPTRIEYLWQKLYRSHRDIRGGPFMVHTISAIDLALWDIAGKLHGVPVYRLLGGPCRDKIRIYHTPKAQKVPPHGIYEHSGSPADVERMLKAVADARAKVGPDGVVMFDAHCAVPPATLIQFASALKPAELLFIEEPAVPGNIEVFKRLKQHINIPLASGERDRTIWEFMPYLQERCLDILQPDVTHSGGITQLKKIATLAEAYQVPLAPHNTNSLLGLSASLHLVTSIPLFLIHEAYGFNPKNVIKSTWEVDKNGYVALPPGPGLGMEPDEAILEELARDTKFKWPVYGRLKDGSIADY
jgi:galactonate dehydratase